MSTGEWNLSDPDIEIANGVVKRTYHAACYKHETKVRGAAVLSVLFWLAPRGSWGEIVVKFPRPDRWTT
jgi:hypothetical protein